MSQLIEVAFKGNRKEFFRWEQPVPPPVNAPVIVEADRGEDLGRVHSVGDVAILRNEKCSHGLRSEPPARRALRVASPDDARRERELREQDEQARRTAMHHVRTHGLDMKLTDSEWQWDGRKLTLYFTADKRVDFRKLVRDLASTFRARIELKQIGVRDEAKRLDGVGRCGRQYCSASWLPELLPVNLGVAKDQRLSLNPSQISGACGRLMCSLRYEHDFYVQSRKRFPKEGRVLITVIGEEKVIATDIFRDRVTLRNSEGDTRTIALLDLRDEIAVATGDGSHAGTDSDSGEAAAISYENESWARLSGRVLPLAAGATTLPDAQRDDYGDDEIAPDPDLIEDDHMDDDDFNSDGPADGTDASVAADGSTDVDAAAGTGKGKRRRGRRGGRRGRRGGSQDPQG